MNLNRSPATTPSIDQGPGDNAPNLPPMGAKTLRLLREYPFQVVSRVAWCGHQLEVLLVPESREWIGEVPVLGEAR